MDLAGDKRGFRYELFTQTGTLSTPYLVYLEIWDLESEKWFWKSVKKCEKVWKSKKK